MEPQPPPAGSQAGTEGAQGASPGGFPVDTILRRKPREVPFPLPGPPPAGAWPRAGRPLGLALCEEEQGGAGVPFPPPPEGRWHTFHRKGIGPAPALWGDWGHLCFSHRKSWVPRTLPPRLLGVEGWGTVKVRRARLAGLREGEGPAPHPRGSALSAPRLDGQPAVAGGQCLAEPSLSSRSRARARPGPQRAPRALGTPLAPPPLTAWMVLWSRVSRTRH